MGVSKREDPCFTVYYSLKEFLNKNSI